MGEFYQFDDKDNELSPEQVNGQVIESGSEGVNVVSSCGREDSASGTQGQFDLYDGDTKVVTLVWDCPWRLWHLTILSFRSPLLVHSGPAADKGPPAPPSTL